jgi:ATP-dependent DNA helicase RecG
MEALRTRYRSYAVGDARKTAGDFAAGLPFQLTGDQRNCIEEIARDLERNFPMNRLLHGDVGSGKTVVGAFALMAAAKQGLQGACLVPTEILAEQHYRTFQAILRPYNISIGLLTSSTDEDRRKRMLAELKNGKLSILVGTHALLQGDVAFSNLAVAMIDEQHKFGVRQRCQLLNRPIRPHQLVMTATPIPRTLALTVYGDLDVSAIRELPAGRQTISTYWITRQKQPDVLRHILERIDQGEQAYFIYPLIDETEKSDLLAAQKGYEQLKKGIFSRVKIGLIHGRLESGDREAVMKAFGRGEIKVLVATSVIEVGVDNPHATVMVIENAERFGLSQLHQMRGRIGRGSKASECFLFGEPKTVEGQKRLRIMTKTRDGFVIAEEDLKLRGPGEFLGTKQSGTPLFKCADPLADEDSLLVARDIAAECLREKWLTSLTEWEVLRRHLEDCNIQY